MLDLRTIPRADLLSLITVCRSFAESQSHNRYFEDQGVILSRVVFGLHEMREMSEYSNEELREAVDYFQSAIDEAESIPDDYPSKVFLKYCFTAAHEELVRRSRKENLHAVK